MLSVPVENDNGCLVRIIHGPWCFGPGWTQAAGSLNVHASGLSNGGDDALLLQILLE
jgi:hypothetical protein